MTKEKIGDLAVELDEKEQLFEVLESMPLRWRGVVFMIHENV